MGMATLTNASGADFANAFLVVRSNGSTGQMVLAQGDTDPHAAKIVGVCLNAAADNADGAVADTGDCPIQGDGTLAAGDTAYLSGATAGRVSATPGASSVALGVVLKILSGDRVLVNLLASPGVNPALLKANNLSDVASAPASRLNLAALGAVFGPDMDCFSAPGTTWTVLPAQTGKFFVNGVTPIYLIISKGGTLTTAPAFKVGTNGAHDNYSATLTVTTTTNFNSASVGYKAGFGTAVVAGVFQPCPDFSSPLVIELVTQAVGTGSPSLVIRPLFFFSACVIP